MPKTGGHTLNQVLWRWYDGARVFRTSEALVDKFGDAWIDVPIEDRWQCTESAFANLPAQDRNSLDAVFGHMYFGGHRYVEEKCQYVTFVRDPVRRIVSYYNFIRGRDDEYELTQIVRDNNLGIGNFVELEKIDFHNNMMTKVLSGSQEITDDPLEKAKHNVANHFLCVRHSQLRRAPRSHRVGNEIPVAVLQAPKCVSKVCVRRRIVTSDARQTQSLQRR